MQQPIRIELPTFFGMKTVNCFLFKTPVPTLIDCGEGTADVWEATKAGLKENGLDISDIKRVVITHAHVDHIGNAARIASASGAEIWVSDLVRPWAVDLEKMWAQREHLMLDTLKSFLGKEAFGNFIPTFEYMSNLIKKSWPSVPASQLRIFEHEGEIELGGSIWKTIYMPGHSANQSCFFNPQNGHLLSADMLLKITPTPVLDANLADPSQREKGVFKLLESYQRLLGLDISTVFPGHYANFENAHQIINHQVGRIHLRKGECLKLIKSGRSSFMEIAQALYPLDLHLPAMNMVVAYLDLLEEEGAIRLMEEDEMIKILPK